MKKNQLAMTRSYHQICFVCDGRRVLNAISSTPSGGPRIENPLKLSLADLSALGQVKEFIEQYDPDEPLSLKQLCRRFGLNEFKLKKGFRQLYHHSVYDYFLKLKMAEAKRLLQQYDATVNAVAYRLGYQHASNFCIQFKKRVGLTPKEWRTLTFKRSVRTTGSRLPAAGLVLEKS